MTRSARLRRFGGGVGIGCGSIALPALLVAAGCLGRPMSNRSAAHSTQAIVEETAIRSAIEQIQTKKVDYKIGGADLLIITVYQQDDMSRQVRVGQNGTISFPLVGAIKVGGLTVTEAEAAISGRLKEYLIDPQVTIFIREYGNKKIFVLGEVKKPGSFELPTESKFTVLEAISLAEGFTQIAAPDRTRVIRTVDGKSQNFVIAVSEITKHGRKDKDMQLEPNDVIYVPQSFF